MLNKLKQWWSFDPATYETPDGIPSPDEPRELVLYKFDTCPFCIRVMRVLDQTGVQAEMRDTRTDPAARQELLDRTGRTQVPCLFIDDVPLFESRDISQWLLAYAERGAP
jgi:glutaredoxin